MLLLKIINLCGCNVFCLFKRENEREFFLLYHTYIYIYTQLSVLKDFNETKIHQINYPKKINNLNEFVCVCMRSVFSLDCDFSMVSLLVARSIQCRFVAIAALASGGRARISAACACQCPGNVNKIIK